MKLILVAHRCGTALEVADVASLFRDDECALELARIGGIDAEVRGQLHRTTHALRNVDERAVTEDRAVQRSVEVVRHRHYGAQVLADELRVLLHGLRKRHEDDAHLGELVPEGRGHRDAVEHGIDGNTCEHLALVKRNAKLLVGREELRVDLVEALWSVVLALRRGVVTDLLVVDRGVADLCPGWFFHLEPATVRLEPPIEQPLGLLLLLRDEPHDLFAETGRRVLLLDVGDEARVVSLLEDFVDRFGSCGHALLHPGAKPIGFGTRERK